MPANKVNYKKANFYIYIEERNKALIVESKFLDYVTVFTHS